MYAESVQNRMNLPSEQGEPAVPHPDSSNDPNAGTAKRSTSGKPRPAEKARGGNTAATDEVDHDSEHDDVLSSISQQE